jgi:Uma2 family endonuclease
MWSRKWNSEGYMVTQSLIIKPEIEYPESDGQPMAETSIHIDTLIYLLTALRDLFRNAADVFVGGNMMMYYEEGEPRHSVAPDVFVVRGVPKHDRRMYKIWEEGKSPTVFFEVTSRSTRLDDLGIKRGLYAMLGVQEYFLFDPLNEYLTPQLQGFRLARDEYAHIEPNENGNLFSNELGVEFGIINREIRVIDPVTRNIWQTPLESLASAREAEQAAREAEEAAREAEAHARAVEAENARLRAELEKLRGQQD